PCIAALADFDKDVREVVARALGMLRDASAIESLVVALTDSQTPVRNAASHSLRWIDENWEKSQGAQNALPRLKDALKDWEYRVRHAAACAIDKINAACGRLGLDGEGLAADFVHRQMVLQAMADFLTDYDRDLRL